MYRNLTCLIEETPVIITADVLCSARAGRVALKGLVPIKPEGPGFILGGPVAGEAVGGLLVGVEMGFCILYISPPVMVCKTIQSLHSQTNFVTDVDTRCKVDHTLS